MRRLRVDLTPLRESSEYRLLFSSGLITFLGSMITMIALPFQVAQLTDSFLAVGLIGAAELVPVVVLGLYGGSLADRVDRRVMLLVTETASMLLALVLTVNALLPDPSLWVIYIGAFLLAASDSLQRPSLDAAIPRVVRHDQLAAAGVLNTVRWNLGSIVGPAIGGILVSTAGAGAAYAIDAVSFAVSLALLWRLRPMLTANRVSTSAVRHVMQGLRYAATRRDILGTYAVDLIAMTFAFPNALFPFLAQELDATWALGLLYSAGAVGGLLVTATSGWIGQVHRHGRAVAIAAALWGLGIAVAGASDSVLVVLLALAFAGAADMTSGIFRGLIWNQTIPDEMRGRMAGIELLSYSIGPLAGQVRGSTVASLSSLRASLVSGGVLCIVGVALAALSFRSLWQYDDRTNQHAVRERTRRAANDEVQ